MSEELGLSIRFIRDVESKDARLLRVHIAGAVVEGVQQLGLQPNSYAWRAWWETQIPAPRVEWPAK